MHSSSSGASWCLTASHVWGVPGTKSSGMRSTAAMVARRRQRRVNTPSQLAPDFARRIPCKRARHRINDLLDCHRSQWSGRTPAQNRTAATWIPDSPALWKCPDDAGSFPAVPRMSPRTSSSRDLFFRPLERLLDFLDRHVRLLDCDPQHGGERNRFRQVVSEDRY